MSSSVPEGWKEDFIGTYVAGSVAGEWGKEARGDKNDIPVLRATNFTENGAVDYKKLAIRNIDEKKRVKKLLKTGDIVLEKSGGSPTQPVGRVIYFDNEKPFLYSNFTQKISPTNKCVSKYLFYKLYHEYQQGTVLKFQQQTTGIINFQLAEYLLYKTIFPPLPEQKKIAAILTSVDTVIEKTQAQIDKLKDLKTGMMQELLTKGIGHTEFKDSPVGRIPVEWGVDSIESFGISILDGDRGKEYPKEKDFFQNEYCLFLSAKNVTKHGFKFNETVYITKKKDDLLRKGKLIRNDIVITTRGTVGNIALYDDSISYNHIRINSGMAIIRNQEDKLDTEYLNLVLHSPLVCEQIELLAFGSAQPQLTIGLIKNLFIPKPDIEEQNKISKSIGSIQEKISIVESKLKSLQNTKKALMQDLLTGKVRVKV